MKNLSLHHTSKLVATSKIRIELKLLVYESNPEKTNNHKLSPNLPIPSPKHIKRTNSFQSTYSLITLSHSLRLINLPTQSSTPILSPSPISIASKRSAHQSPEAGNVRAKFNNTTTNPLSWSGLKGPWQAEEFACRDKIQPGPKVAVAETCRESHRRHISNRWNTAAHVIAAHIGRIIQTMWSGIVVRVCCVRRRPAWGDRRGPPAVNTEIRSPQRLLLLLLRGRRDRRGGRERKVQRWRSAFEDSFKVVCLWVEEARGKDGIDFEDFFNLLKLKKYRGKRENFGTKDNNRKKWGF